MTTVKAWYAANPNAVKNPDAAALAYWEGERLALGDAAALAKFNNVVASVTGTPVQTGSYAGIADLQPTAAALATGGGSFFLPNGQLAIPVYGQGGYDASVGDYVAGPVTNYYVYDKAAGEGGTARYAGAPITVTDTAGNVTGATAFAADIGKTDWIEAVGQIGVAIGAALVGGNALGLIGAPGGAAAAGSGTTAGPVLSKAALDGTTAFGANSVPGALELGGTVASGSGALGTTVSTAAASTGGTLASTVSTAVRTVTGLTGAVLAAAGVGNTAAQQNNLPATRLPVSGTPGTQQNNLIWGVLGAAVLGYLAFKG